MRFIECPTCDEFSFGPPLAHLSGCRDIARDAGGVEAWGRFRLPPSLALWTQHSAAAGRSLGERLKSLDWHSAALSGRR